MTDFVVLVQESVSVAQKTGAIGPRTWSGSR